MSSLYKINVTTLTLCNGFLAPSTAKVMLMLEVHGNGSSGICRVGVRQR